MSWIFKYGVSAFSVLCYIVILNGICGWIGFGIWSCLKRIWERNGQYEILYYCLKIVILLFILPLGWIMIVSRNQMLGSNITYNWYPWANSKMAVFLTSVFVIWFLGASKNFMEADPRIPIHNKPASGQTTVVGNQNGFPQNK